MRLLFINERLNFAGTSSYTLDLACALKKAGDEVRVCALGGDLRRVFTELGIESYLVRFNPFSFRQLLEFLREFDPDLIHFQNLRSAPFGLRLVRKLKIPYLVTVHRAPDETSPRVEGPLLAGVIAANEIIREALVNHLRIPKTLIRVIHRGVDTLALSPELAGLPSPERGWIPVVGSVGNLTRVKGHHVFLRAARQVLDSGVEAMFALVGEGEDEPYLRRLTRELGLESHVTFSPHIASRRELYRTFDVVVVPTLRGGVGSTALEVMSMAKPVVASAVGELLHIIQDGKTGLLTPEGDAESLAGRIRELLVDADLRRSLGEAARAYIVDNFALEPMVKSTRELYEEVCLRHAEESNIAEA